MKRSARAAVALIALLAALPAAALCTDKVVLLPLEPVAIDRTAVQQVEQALRTVLQQRWGDCLEPRHETVARIAAAGGELPACEDDACIAAQVRFAGARWLVRGVLLGAGGRWSLTLALWGPRGAVTRRTSALADTSPDSVRPAVAALWDAASPRRGPAWIPHVTVGAGVAALATGAVLGWSSRGIARELSAGNAGCPEEQLRACVERKLETGRNQALAANVLYGVGGVLAAGGVALFVWELP